MLNMMKLWGVAVIVQLIVPHAAVAQYPSDLQGRLEERAASDPELAGALQRQADVRYAWTYSEQEFLDSVQIEWVQYSVSPDPKAVFCVGSRGSGSIGSTLGSGVQWIDKESGKTVALSYDARSTYSPKEGLSVGVTIEIDGGQPTTTHHVFENLAPITVVLREWPDGTRHLARYTAVVGEKRTIVDYSPTLRMSLSSAALLVDGEFGGEFTVSGSIVGITSSKAGMTFEFGLKPFADAQPIGRTDGRTICFEHGGRSCRLYSIEPITTLAPEGTQWKVYVRGWATDALGTGTHSKTYDTLLIQDAMESMTR